MDLMEDGRAFVPTGIQIPNPPALTLVWTYPLSIPQLSTRPGCKTNEGVAPSILNFSTWRSESPLTLRARNSWRNSPWVPMNITLRGTRVYSHTSCSLVTYWAIHNLMLIAFTHRGSRGSAVNTVIMVEMFRFAMRAYILYCISWQK